MSNANEAFDPFADRSDSRSRRARSELVRQCPVQCQRPLNWCGATRHCASPIRRTASHFPMDLIFRRANLPDGRTGIDIGIEGDRIVAVEPQLQATAADEIDAGGRLLSPPFVDAHFHMDATLSLGLPRMNRSGNVVGRYRALGGAETAVDP